MPTIFGFAHLGETGLVSGQKEELGAILANFNWQRDLLSSRYFLLIACVAYLPNTNKSICCCPKKLYLSLASSLLNLKFLVLILIALNLFGFASSLWELNGLTSLIKDMERNNSSTREILFSWTSKVTWYIIMINIAKNPKPKFRAWG
jgi:hypothetical protein